jgi:beta-glucosidase
MSVLLALKQRGLEPVVTLHHFTNPAWFEHAGGWTSSRSVGWFARYVTRVVTRLGPLVRYWLTINEPTVYIKHAYVTGKWPPCRNNSWPNAIRAVLNMARAHRAAYSSIHKVLPNALVGFAHSAPYVVPCDSTRWADRWASRMREYALNHAFFRLLGRRPRKWLDFIGINYYARQVVRWKPALGPGLLFGAECTENHHETKRTFSSLGWEVFPQGLGQVLRRFARYGVPLMVTENGIATRDERFRTEFLQEHVRAVVESVRQGIPVLGYLYWTLIDNYEWTEGIEARFGLVDVDFSNQHRSIRPAGVSFRQLIADICF